MRPERRWSRLSVSFADIAWKSSHFALSRRMIGSSKVRTRSVINNVVSVRDARARMPVQRLVVGPKDVLKRA